MTHDFAQRPHAPPRTRQPAPIPPPPTRSAFGWIATRNPFYAISAGLFLFGLRISLGDPSDDIQIGALMIGLSVYTALLAGAALFLVRFADVWDDVRTILLLVVLMFLATSVTFDDFFVARPRVAALCELAGFAVAVLISEVLLHGIRLSFPVCYRGPYYLILGLVFLYPIALAPVAGHPQSEVLQWGIFAFMAVAGAAFLTLIPAIHFGPRSVGPATGPWRWPLYPWVVFGVLALAIPGRAYLLCLSMHWLPVVQRDATIFGPVFFVPFVLCLAALLIETAVARRRPIFARIALAAPIVLVVAAFAPQPRNEVFQDFQRILQSRLGGDALFVTLGAAVVFYGYAALRGTPGAIPLAAGSAGAMGVFGPDFLRHGPAMMPLLDAYRRLRKTFAGIDFVILSLASLAVAVTISLLKSGRLRRPPTPVEDEELVEV